MAQKIQNSANVDVQIPSVEFDPRTGKPLFPEKYYDNPNPYNYPQSDGKDNLKPKGSGKPHRGFWLAGKLQTLYNDPKYLQGTSEQQKRWKELAYEKWVIPYYKNVLKTDPPPVEYYTDPKKYVENFNRAQAWQNALTKDKVHGLAILEETSHIMAGFQDDLSYVGKGIDFIMGKFTDKLDQITGLDKGVQKINQSLGVNTRHRKGPLESFYGDPNNQPFRNLEHYYQGRIDDLEQGKKKVLLEKFADKIPSFVTDGVFFEATGGKKTVSALRIGYPKMAGFIAKRAIDSLNGAVDFAIWNKTTGESGTEGLKWGAMFGPVVVPIFSSLFKFGGAESLGRVINDATEKASKKTETAGEFLDRLLPKSKPHPTTEKATQVVTDAMNGYSQEKFGKPYVDLAHIQKTHVLNRVLAEANAAIKTAGENIPAEIVQAASKEERDMVEQIFPEAKKAQQNVDAFVKQHSDTPQTNKFLATLPQHNTTIDSKWSHLQARVSFLKGRLRLSKDPSEQKAITEALNEEYQIMKEKSEREKILKAAAEGKMKAEGKRPDKQKIKKKSIDPGPGEIVHPEDDITLEDEREYFKNFKSNLSDQPLTIDAVIPKGELPEKTESTIKEEAERKKIIDAAKKGKFRAEASKEGRTVGLPDYKIGNAPMDMTFNGVREWQQDSFAKNIMMADFQKNGGHSTFGNAIQNSYKLGAFISKMMLKDEGVTKLLYHPQYGLVGAVNYELFNKGGLGEQFAYPITQEAVIYINYLSMRPNVVARIWEVPGGGQALFHNVARLAADTDRGIVLQPYDESEKFYEKMGMQKMKGYMVMTASQVKEMLQNKGLLMMLLGAGISYGASKIDKFGDYSVRPKDLQ